jgi:hypothetical protein
MIDQHNTSDTTSAQEQIDQARIDGIFIGAWIRELLNDNQPEQDNFDMDMYVEILHDMIYDQDRMIHFLYGLCIVLACALLSGIILKVI